MKEGTNLHSIPLRLLVSDERELVGALMLANLGAAMEGYALALFTRHAGMSQNEAKALCDEARNSAHDRSMHIYNFV
jgi:hypothetical protein